MAFFKTLFQFNLHFWKQGRIEVVPSNIGRKLSFQQVPDTYPFSKLIISIYRKTHSNKIYSLLALADAEPRFRVRNIFSMLPLFSFTGRLKSTLFLLLFSCFSPEGTSITPSLVAGANDVFGVEVLSLTNDLLRNTLSAMFFFVIFLSSLTLARSAIGDPLLALLESVDPVDPERSLVGDGTGISGISS